MTVSLPLVGLCEYVCVCVLCSQELGQLKTSKDLDHHRVQTFH